MTTPPFKLDKEKIISLLLVLVLANFSLAIKSQFPILNTIIQQVLLYFGLFGYSVVLLVLLYYYYSKANSWLNKDRFRLIITMSIILAVGHSSFTGAAEKSWLKFFGYLLGDGVIILIGMLSYKQWEKKNQNSNKLK